jgi:ABC-type transport system substrate-binding protein
MSSIKVLLLLIVSLSMVAALACAADEDPTVVPAAAQQPAAQPTSPPAAVPAAQPTVAKAAAPAPAAKVATAVVTKPAPTVAESGTAGAKVIAVPLMPKPVYKYDVPLDENQMVIWPVSRRSAIEFWKEGSVKGRYWQRWTHMGPFAITTKDEFAQGVATGYSVNDDGSVYTLHFDPDAVFTDGTPFTAALAKASWEFGSAPEQQASWGGLIGSTKVIQGMDAVGKGDASEASGLVVIDDHTLELRLVDPSFTFPLEMTKGLMGFANIPALEIDPNWRDNMPGIGQFQVTWDPDSTEAFVTKSPNFWRDPPTLAGVSMPVVTDQQTQFIMYENGEIDVGPNFAVKEDPSHPFYNDMIYPRSGGCCYYYAFNLGKAPFEDRNIRAALAHATDMETIVSAVFPGSGTAAGIINGDLSCIDPEKEVYRYDPSYARQLLADSTYGSGANLPPITVSLKSANFIKIAEVMQEQWRDNLGVELNILRRESGQSIPPEANLYRRSAGTVVPDYGQIMWALSHSKSGSVDDLGWEADPNQAKIDALVDKASTLTLDDPGRCDAFIEAERALTDSYKRIPSLAVAGGHAGNLVAPWVLGFQAAWYGDWANVPYWKIGKRDRSLYPGHSWR